MKEEYTQIKDAFADVRMKGYGVVSPKKEEVVLEEPVIIRQGNKYGVKIHSEAPSIHMIRANIETDIAPKGNFRKIPLVRPQGKRYNEMYGI